ncbi:hypothetical protein BGX27_001716 [Mortierella sp. AM989]|nr:hypothetical protein BGX27_001716 [Mortierella sp. AM989]
MYFQPSTVIVVILSVISILGTQMPEVEGDKDGQCKGYARRFPLDEPFDIGSNETLADPPEKAYDGKYGVMTHTRVGDMLCVRWPAKTHADNEKDNGVQINISNNKDGEDPTQETLLKNKITELSYKNCGPAPSGDSRKDKRPCGGCFKVPKRSSGHYLLQWRWMLNEDEWYTSCAVSN